MAVRVVLYLDYMEVLEVLMYEAGKWGNLPELSGDQIREKLHDHFVQMSRSRRQMMEQEEIIRTATWAKEVVVGKGFHFKPRNPRK